MLPRYPIYVPSKGRYAEGHTMKFLIKDGIPFYLVVEPQEAEAYRSRYPEAQLLILPWSGDDAARQQFCRERSIENGGLIAVRNWIKEHSIGLGAERHWQIDDNITCIKRRYQGKRIPCNAGIGLGATEDFVDRYANVAIAGLNYEMFLPNGAQIAPFQVNSHVYSCTLVLNRIPHRWRVAYNDDTDICLQVLSEGWCTILMNAFFVFKIRTMVVKGGNTDDLYQGDGRLKMARALERLWPGVVETDRRYGRPQHVINWKHFNTPLRLKEGINLDDLTPNEYGMQLRQVKPIKSEVVQDILHTFNERDNENG